MYGCVPRGWITKHECTRQVLAEPGLLSRGCDLSLGSPGTQPIISRQAAEAAALEQQVAIEITFWLHSNAWGLRTSRNIRSREWCVCELANAAEMVDCKRSPRTPEH